MIPWRARRRLVKGALGAVTGLFLAYQWLPMLTMAFLSFTGPEGGTTFPMRGVSLYWYRELLRVQMVDDFKPPMARSLALAVACSLTTAALALAAAQAMRARFRGSGLYFYLILLGVMAPGLLVGFGVALLARALGLGLAWYTSTFAVHIVWTLPFGFLTMLAVFNRFDRRLEEAALTLRATRWTAFWRITFPLVLPGVIGAALFGFTLSFDEFARSLFASGPEQTLPLVIYAQFDRQLQPTLYAIGTATTVVSLGVIGGFAVLFRLVKRRTRTVRAAAIREGALRALNVP
jgi:putative spermidine/putrescine transport system permease protein